MKKIYIDPGHGTVTASGSRDKGAVAASGLSECSVALEIALMAEKLLDGRAETKLSRRDNNTQKGINDRAAEANGWKADIVVSIHCNSAQSPSAHGIETLITAAGGQAGQIAEDMLKAVCAATGLANRGVKLRPELGILRLTNAPAVLLEAGFLSNPTEAALLADSGFLRKVAAAVADSVAGIKSGGDSVTDTKIRVGADKIISGKLIDGITYVPLRDIIAAVQPSVVWTPEDGAGVVL